MCPPWLPHQHGSTAHTPPTEGFPPAPSPRVSLVPIWMRLGGATGEVASAWASVLATHSSTPVSSLFTMRFTALEPPPPTPMTWSGDGGARLGSRTAETFAVDARRVVAVEQPAKGRAQPQNSGGGASAQPASANSDNLLT